jgi:hypothetical protein
MLFTDSMGFNRHSVINCFHNNHLLTEGNIHSVVKSRHQWQFTISVWVGIVGDYLVGPNIQPYRRTGNEYQNFLVNELPTVLDDVPVTVRKLMWFMHDGAPTHFSFVV